MYKVYVNKKLLYDPNINDLTIMNPLIELEDNSSSSFKFMISPKHPLYGMFNQDPKTNIEVYENNKEEPIFAGRVIKEKDNFKLIKTVECEGELAYLNDSIQGQGEYHDLTVRQYLETLINVHNSKVESEKQFQVGIVTVKDSNDKLFKYTNFEQTLKVIKTDLINTYGGHLRIRHQGGIRYIDYLDDYVRDSSQIIEFGKNLLDFTRNFDMTNMCTALIPLGAKLDEPGEIKALEHYVTVESVNNGNQIIKNQAGIDAFGYIEKVKKFENVGTPTNLLKKGQEYLKEQQFADMILDLKAIDLFKLGIEPDNINLLDRVKVKSKVHGLDKFFPVTKMSISLDKPSNNTFTLGVKTKTTMSSNNNNAIGGIKEEIKRIPNEAVQSAINNASQIIQNALTGYCTVRPDEILIMDTDNIETATKIWRFNMGGLGYSSTGYNGNFGIAMTMDGQIVGDYIVANSITADKIDINYKNEVNAGIDKAKNEAISASQVQLKTTADGIMSTVSQTYETIDGSTAKKQEAINAGKDFANQAEINANSNLNTYKKEVGTYLRHDVNGVELGDVNGKFKINVTPKSQEFSEDNVVTAFINNKEFHFNAGTVEHSLRIGGYVFKHDAEGHTSLEWEEETKTAELEGVNV